MMYIEEDLRHFLKQLTFICACMNKTTDYLKHGVEKFNDNKQMDVETTLTFGQSLKGNNNKFGDVCEEYELVKRFIRGLYLSSKPYTYRFC